jgi:hypothetical protein
MKLIRIFSWCSCEGQRPQIASSLMYLPNRDEMYLRNYRKSEHPCPITRRIIPGRNFLYTVTNCRKKNQKLSTVENSSLFEKCRHE